MPVIPWFADGGTPKAMSDAVDSIFEVLQGGQGVLTIPVGPEKSVLIPLQSIDHVEICYTALEVDDEA